MRGLNGEDHRPTSPGTKPHHRRSIRLKGYDYTQPGAYFVTIVTHNRTHLFGQVVNGEMVQNVFGKIVEEEWFRTAQVRPYVELFEHEFVVMPNHIHGIIWIVEHDDVGAQRPHQTRRGNPQQRNTTIPRGHHPVLQIRGDQTHKRIALHTRRTRVATKLLGTHHPQRTGPKRHPPVHH